MCLHRTFCMVCWPMQNSSGPKVVHAVVRRLLLRFLSPINQYAYIVRLEKQRKKKRVSHRRQKSGEFLTWLALRPPSHLEFQSCQKQTKYRYRERGGVSHPLFVTFDNPKLQERGTAIERWPRGRRVGTIAAASRRPSSACLPSASGSQLSAAAAATSTLLLTHTHVEAHTVLLCRPQSRTTMCLCC